MFQRCSSPPPAPQPPPKKKKKGISFLALYCSPCHVASEFFFYLAAALSFLMNQWFQLSSLQPAQMTAPGLEQCWAGPQMNIPPVNTTPFTPFSNAMTQFPWNLQNGSELRAHSSHLQAVLSPSLQTAHVSTPYSWMPNLQSPSNPLVKSFMPICSHQSSPYM